MEKDIYTELKEKILISGIFHCSCSFNLIILINFLLIFQWSEYLVPHWTFNLVILSEIILIWIFILGVISIIGSLFFLKKREKWWRYLKYIISLGGLIIIPIGTYISYLILKKK